MALPNSYSRSSPYPYQTPTKSSSRFVARPPMSPYGTPPKSASILSSPPPFIPATTTKSRLQSLYSDFSGQKHSNSEAYHANVDWWRRTLERYVGEGYQTQGSGSGSSRLMLRAGKALVDDFRVEGVGKPIGLDTVITELSPSLLIPVQTFLSLSTSLYGSNSSKSSYLTTVPTLVLSYLVAKPLWWALEQAGVVGEDSLASSVSSMFTTRSKSSSASDARWYGDYVLFSLVERAGDKVIESQDEKMGLGSPADALYTFESFRKEFARCVGSEEEADSGSGSMNELDMKVLLRYLEREKGVVVVDNGIVKFIDTDSEDETEITAVDRGILELKTAVANLRVQIEGIQRKSEICKQKASSALSQSQKPMALSYLRSKKLLDELLSKRLGALGNLEGTLIQVEGAAGDIEILASYKSSTTTLRSILSHPSLQRDSIEQTMEAMAEANENAKEIDEAVRIGGAVALGIDSSRSSDQELEEELRRLVEEDQREKEEAQVREVREKLGGIRIPETEMGSREESERDIEAVAVVL